MDFQSAMETFAEAWVAANTQTPLTEAAEAQSLAGVPPSVGVAPPPTGGGTATSTGGGASGVGGQPGAPRAAPSSPPPSSLAAQCSPEEQDRSSSSCEAVAPTRPPPNVLADVVRNLFREEPTDPMQVDCGKTLPVHCVVERVPSPQTDSQQPSVEVDSYAIVPSAALFVDLVRTALTKLGYSPSEAICAKGVVQIKNWKPLSFDQITELPEATVGDMLSDLVQVATLRIRLYSRPKPNVVNDVKEKLLQVLLAQSHSLLLSSGCPIDQTTLAALTKGKAEWEISEDTRKKFDQWYLHQVFQHCRQVALLQHQLQQQQLQQQQKHASVAVPPPPRLLQLSLSQPPLQTPQPPPIPSNPELWTMDSVKTAVIQLLREMSQSKLAKICPLKQSLLSTIVNNKFTGKLGAEKCKEFGTWFMQYRQSSPASAMAFLDEDRPPQDGRMTFHSITELPRMRDWFRQCPHPTNLQLQDFANQLNSESLRLRNKPKVTVNCLKNWWKNERQRERRTSKRRSPGGVDDDSNPGNSASSSSTHCPVPIKIAAAVTTASTAATACIIHQHRSPSSPPAHSPSPQPSQPQVTRPSAPSFSSTPHNRPQHPVVTLATHDYGARAAAAMMPLRHLHHLHHHHHHHPRFVPASSGGVVPAASSSPGDLVVALSTTSPS